VACPAPRRHRLRRIGQASRSKAFGDSSDTSQSEFHAAEYMTDSAKR
jgi:hypothetical protein